MTPRIRELTPPGRGAVSVLEVTGPGAFEWVRGRARRTLRPRRLEVTRLAIADDLEDEALVWAESEDRVEVHVHGAPVIVARFLEQLEPAADGGSLEQRARRAAGHALGADAARILLDQAAGALGEELGRVAALPFDEGTAALDELLERGRWMRRLSAPTRVVLVGAVNAGKSTLFNAVVGRERVVVSDEPGTTRDAIAESVQLGPWPVELWDTAGARELGGGAWERLEAEGQEVGRREASEAELAVELVPASGTDPVDAPDADPPLRYLRSRADEIVSHSEPRDARAISARRDPAGAAAALRALFEDHFDLPPAPWVPGRAVPFESGQVEGLERARSAADEEARRRELEGLRTADGR